MKLATRSLALVVVVVATAQAVAQPAKPVPSSRLKAYAGPEGEVIALVEANDGKQMLVHFRNIDGLDGKTLLYDYEDLGDHGKTVFITKKRGSKTYRSTVLASSARGWQFFHPDRSTVHFDVTYSDEASKKIKVDDVLAAYKP